MVWYENDGGAPEDFQRYVIQTAAKRISSLCSADLDGDDDMDIVSASIDDSRIAWHENNGVSPPSFSIHTLSTSSRVEAVFSADLDNDGDIDVITAQDGGIAWFENDGGMNPFFRENIVSSGVGSTASVYVADFDNDHDPDIVVGFESSTDMIMYRNDGMQPPNFSSQELPDSILMGGVMGADMDDDGDLDIVSFSSESFRLGITWFENMLEDASFLRHTISRTTFRYEDVAVADVDGDGDLDVMGAPSSRELLWYESNLTDLSNSPTPTPTPDPTPTSEPTPTPTPPTGPIQLFSPNGGQTLMGNTVIDVVWGLAAEAGQTVRIELWNNPGRVEVLGYDWHPEGRGAASVYLPLVPFGEDYRVRVVSTWAPELFDDSDAPLTITGGAVLVIWPNGGETWPAESEQSIHWQTNPAIAGTGPAFELWAGGQWVADLGFGWHPIGKDVSPVRVPAVPSGADYRVRVVSTWAPGLFDDSDAPFTITDGPGGEGGDNAIGTALWSVYE